MNILSFRQRCSQNILASNIFQFLYHVIQQWHSVIKFQVWPSLSKRSLQTLRISLYLQAPWDLICFLVFQIIDHLNTCFEYIWFTTGQWACYKILVVRPLKSSQSPCLQTDQLVFVDSLLKYDEESSSKQKQVLSQLFHFLFFADSRKL